MGDTVHRRSPPINLEAGGPHLLGDSIIGSHEGADGLPFDLQHH